MPTAQAPRKAKPKASSSAKPKHSTVLVPMAAVPAQGSRARSSQPTMVFEVRRPLRRRRARRQSPAQLWDVPTDPLPPQHAYSFPQFLSPAFPPAVPFNHPTPALRPIAPPSPPASPPQRSRNHTAAAPPATASRHEARRPQRRSTDPGGQTVSQDQHNYDSFDDDTGSLLSSKFASVINSMDRESFTGNEIDLVFLESFDTDTSLRGGWGVSRSANDTVAKASKTKRARNCFGKVQLYANSRLPPNTPSFQMYLHAWPLVCLAANSSLHVYERTDGQENSVRVDANWRLGTKAMTLKSVPVDAQQVVVFAIRGSQTFMDWAVNLNTVPLSPDGFLDDPGNLCHRGFLEVARRMVAPAAARLDALLQDDPARSQCSLVLTGHSAGGAVASLLFAHMTAENPRQASRLSRLARCFKRVHCITFGAPPVSLLALRKPSTRPYTHSLFLSFINEGDPVPRADPKYMRSLMQLYLAPSPPLLSPARAEGPNKLSKLLRIGRPRPPQRAHTAPPPAPVVEWPVPAGTLSTAGRLVVLREGPKGNGDLRVLAASDQSLRGVVYGDPMMHMMKRYAQRVEVLATRAVMGRGLS